MSIKKHPEADLEKKKPLFFLIGLAIALGLTLIAFEWKSSDASNYELGDVQYDDVEEEIIPITRMMEPPPPPPVKPPPPPPPPTQFEETEEETEEDPEFDSEDEEDDEQEDYEQEEEDVPQAPAIFVVVEQMPAFKGCENKSGDALRTCNYIETTKYFNRSQSYPYLERENEIEGTVYINFVIDERGNPSEIKILKSVSDGLDKEATRLIKSMPKWTPGKQRGKPVKVSQTLPMKFALE